MGEKETSFGGAEVLKATNRHDPAPVKPFHHPTSPTIPCPNPRSSVLGPPGLDTPAISEGPDRVDLVLERDRGPGGPGQVPLSLYDAVVS